MVRPDHRRSPGFNEQAFLYRNIDSYYSNFNVTACYSKHILRAVLSHALSSLIKKNYWLSYNFFPICHSEPPNVKNDYELRYVNKICFDSVVSYRKIHHFDEKVLEEINTFKNEVGRDDAPLWQICVFETENTQYVCAYFCHSLADGGTALQFHRDLLHELELFDDVETEIDTLFVYDSKLPPIKRPTESLTDLYYPGFFQRIWYWTQVRFPCVFATLQRVWDLISGNQKKSLPPVFYSVPIEKNLDTKFKIVNFSPAQVAKITKFCRSIGVTLTPFFNVIGLNSIEKVIYPHFPHENGEACFSSSNFIAIDGRRYYKDRFKAFVYGTLVCGAAVIYHPIEAHSDTDLIRCTQEFHQIIQDEIQTRRSFKKVWLMGIIDFPKMMYHKIGSTLRYTTMISNLGKVVDVPLLQWRIVNAWFGLNTSVNYHFIFNMVSTDSGGLNLVIPYHPFYDTIHEEVDGKNIPAMDRLVLLLQDTICRIVG